MISEIVLLLSLLHPQGDSSRPELSGISQAPIRVAPDGSYWSGKNNGMLFVSRDRGATWQSCSVPVNKNESYFLNADRLEEVHFLTDDVGIVVGSFSGKYGYLRTQTGGANWSFHEFPSSMLPSGVSVASNGDAWVFGGTGEILFSNDLGKNWTPLTRPFIDAIQVSSLSFQSATSGIVGGGHNRIRVTNDGGTHWTTVPTPVDAVTSDEEKQRESDNLVGIFTPDGEFDFVPQAPGPSTPVLKVRHFGSGIVVLQDDVYHSATITDPHWRKLVVEGRSVRDFEVHPDGLAVMDEGGYVGLLSHECALLWRSELSIDRGFPVRLGGVSVDGKSVLGYDGRSTLLVAKPGGESSLFSLRQASETAEWDIRSYDLSSDGVMWGVTEYALCRSRDYGQTWSRVETLPEGFRFGVSVEAVNSDEAFLWNYESAHRWSSEDQKFQPLVFSGARRFDYQIKGLEKRSDIWLAYGMRYPKGKMPLSAQLIHGLNADKSIEGLVLASTDKGLNWSLIQSWRGASIEALHLQSDNTLLGYVAGGGLLHGKLDVESPQIDMRAVVEPGSIIDFQMGARFLFTDEGDIVLVGGGYYGESENHFRSIDGGLTWKPIPAMTSWLSISSYCLGSGVRVLVNSRSINDQDGSSTPALKDGIWSDAGKRWSFDGVRKVRVDQSGRLLVEFATGELGVLDAAGERWEKLRPSK